MSAEFVDNLDGTGARMSDHFGLRVSLQSTELTAVGAREPTVDSGTSKDSKTMDASSEQLILEVGAEGVSLSIWSLGIDRVPERFVVKHNEAALGDLLSEEDTAGMRLSGELGTLRTFAEALRTLGRYPWHRFHPLHVHPNFVEAILREVTRLGGKEQAERWKQILLRDMNLE